MSPAAAPSTAPTDVQKLRLFVQKNDTLKNILVNPDNTVKITLGDYGNINPYTKLFEREGNLYELIRERAREEYEISVKEDTSYSMIGQLDQDHLLSRNANSGNGAIEVNRSDLLQNVSFNANHMYKDKYGLDVDMLQLANGLGRQSYRSRDGKLFLASCFRHSSISSTKCSFLGINMQLHGTASEPCNFREQGGAIVFAQNVKENAMKFQTLTCKNGEWDDDAVQMIKLLPKIWPELLGKVLITEVTETPSYFMFLVTHEGQVVLTVTKRDDKEKWSLSGDGLEGGRLWTGHAEDGSTSFTPLCRGVSMYPEQNRKKESPSILKKLWRKLRKPSNSDTTTVQKIEH